MPVDGDLRDLLARASYERHARQRWGMSYYTPWSQLHEAVRTHYWDQQQWIIEAVQTWLEQQQSNSDFGTIGGPMPNQEHNVHLLDDGWEGTQ